MNETMFTGCSKNVQLHEDDFGFLMDKTTGQPRTVRRFTWKNKNSVQVQVISYGATITSIKIPDQNGVVEDIVMGYDDIQGYLHPLNPYFGATVGRVANRIGNGRFQIDNQPYAVSKNRETFTLHGGFIGFDKVVWQHDIRGKAVIFSYLSKDKEEGFPGDLLVNLRCELTDENEFKMEMKAYTTKPTFVNLTNHSYFNLAGHNKGAEEVYNHTVQLNANKITAVNNDVIPTGELLPVKGTIFDLQIPQLLKNVIDRVPGGGYDHNFCVNAGTKNDVIFIARSIHEPSGRTLEVYSNQPGVQFYTANFLPICDPKIEKVIGKLQSAYYRHGSFCFETQNYPDAANHPTFPNAILRPGDCYNNTTDRKSVV